MFRATLLLTFLVLSLKTICCFAAIPRPASQVLENLVRINIFKPTKIEFEVSFDSHPNWKVREIWWFQNAQNFKIQTSLVDSDWLYWETLYRSSQKIGPNLNQMESIKPFSLLPEQIFFITAIPVLNQALNHNSISYQNTSLSRQQGRVAIKFEGTEKSKESALWVDQNSGEVSRVLASNGCDTTYSLSGRLGQYPKIKKIKWLNFNAIVETKLKADITKFDAAFFEKISNLHKESAPTQEAQNFLEHLKRFYESCR
jgi:hypothetical protein